MSHEGLGLGGIGHAHLGVLRPMFNCPRCISDPSIFRAIRNVSGCAEGDQGRRILAASGGLSVRHQPVTDAFGDLRGRWFGQLVRVLAVTPNPVALPKWLAYQFDAMCAASAFFQADAYVGGKSGHVFDPSEVETALQTLC